VREIIFYESDFGDKPAEEFLANLEPAARAKVVRSLDMLRTIPVIPAKFWHKLSDQKLWEVRAEYASNIYRILATTAKGNRVILLHGFQKKSQKTPRQDMKIAQLRKKRYFQRHGYL
jgi:phage-related protein